MAILLAEVLRRWSGQVGNLLPIEGPIGRIYEKGPGLDTSLWTRLPWGTVAEFAYANSNAADGLPSDSLRKSAQKVAANVYRLHLG